MALHTRRSFIRAAGMDPELLARLPDAAKLSIIRHLGMQQQQAAAGTDPPAGAERPPPLLAGRHLQGGLAIVDGFFLPAAVEAARREAQAVLQDRAQAVGMVAGSGGGAWGSAGVRGDRAAFLCADELENSGHAALAGAARALLSLQPWLASQGLDVGGHPSLQLAQYPVAARYVRHRDASAAVPYRSVTAILYLNPGQ